MNCIKSKKKKNRMYTPLGFCYSLPFSALLVLMPKLQQEVEPCKGGRGPIIGTLAGTTHSAVSVWRSTNKICRRTIMQRIRSPNGVKR
mgnify:CR=1 FL=1